MEVLTKHLRGPTAVLFAVAVSAACARHAPGATVDVVNYIGQPTDGQPGLACLNSPVVEYLGIRSDLVCIWPCQDGQSVVITSLVASGGGFSSSVAVVSCG